MNFCHHACQELVVGTRRKLGVTAKGAKGGESFEEERVLLGQLPQRRQYSTSGPLSWAEAAYATSTLEAEAGGSL